MARRPSAVCRRACRPPVAGPARARARRRTIGARGALGALGALSLALAAGPALAQQGGTRITPTLSITQTLTDNSREGSGAEGVTTISPGVSVSSRSGRVQGSVNYSLSGVLHTSDSGRNSLQNRLSASGQAELVPQHLDLSASASISRQAISLFGSQSADGTLTDQNQAELRSLSVTPRLRGVLAGVVGVQAAATASVSDSSETASSMSTSASLTLSSATAGRLGWSLNATHERSDFSAGRETTTDRAIASLIFTPSNELRFTVRGGQERTDVQSLQPQRYDNYGAGLLWTPGPRTSLSADADERYFGRSHAFSLQHRLRRSVIRYTDSQDVTNNSGQTGAGGITAYDLFFQLFASQEPDPVARDALVRGFLESNGIPPDALVGGGFISSAATLQRRQELSLALNGRRTSVVLRAFATRSERADTLSGAPDDLSDGPVRQRGLSATVSHRLTPRDGLNLTASTQRSEADASGQRNTLSSLSMGWNTSLGARSSFALSLRHSESDSATDPYTENALTAAFATRF